jgi:hypothetical protein
MESCADWCSSTHRPRRCYNSGNLCSTADLCSGSSFVDYDRLVSNFCSFWVDADRVRIDERYFPRGREFIPERWTEKPELIKDRRAFIPFSQYYTLFIPRKYTRIADTDFV